MKANAFKPFDDGAGASSDGKYACGMERKMTALTSAEVNKLIRKLDDDKDYWTTKESDGSTYIAAADEEPVIPDYDYAEVSEKIREIDEKVVKLKHALNKSNALNEIDVDGEKMTVDMLLIRMAQLNRRRDILGHMRKMEPKTRISSGLMSMKKTAPEYKYINFDLDLIKAEYEKTDALITKMQLALDAYNHTVTFDVDI